MEKNRRWADYSPEEKLIAIEGYLGGMAKLESEDREVRDAHIAWLREHLPAVGGESEGNYVFISYSHRDYEKVYHDLAYFLYNSETRVRFWYDEGLPAGQNWQEAAHAHITDPKCVGAIFYLSEDFLKSPSVLEEIRMIRATGKAYVTVALEAGHFSAADILRAGDANFEELCAVFPAADTTLSYGEDIENVLYRIGKIEEVFGVTEDVLSDFICEDFAGGLMLTEYRGGKTSIVIPERIGGKDIIAVRAALPQAVSVFVPKTVEFLFPYAEADEYEDVENEKTATVYRLLEHMAGGYQSEGAIFGEASNLAVIRVDDQNPVFYDKNGMLFMRDDILLRMPPKAELTEDALHGVKVIGTGAFYGCKALPDELLLPESLEKIGDCAFENGYLPFMEIPPVKSIGMGAFSGAMGTLLLDINTPKLGAWACRGLERTDSVFVGGEVREIGAGASFGADVELVSLPETVERIGAGAMALCRNLTCVTLPEGLREIGQLAFAECPALAEIELPASLTLVGESIFTGCSGLKLIRYKGKRRALYALLSECPFLEPEQLSLVVCNGEPLRRLRFAIKKRLRRIAEWILEKM